MNINLLPKLRAVLSSPVKAPSDLIFHPHNSFDTLPKYSCNSSGINLGFLFL
jgi:hypothetical protein